MANAIAIPAIAITPANQRRLHEPLPAGPSRCVLLHFLMIWRIVTGSADTEQFREDRVHPYSRPAISTSFSSTFLRILGPRVSKGWTAGPSLRVKVHVAAARPSTSTTGLPSPGRPGPIGV